MSDINIALNRFGLGARPDEAAPADPKRWLADQLTRFDARPAAFAQVPNTRQIAGELADYLDSLRGLRQQQGPRRAVAGVQPPANMPMPGATQPAPEMAAQAPDPVRQARQFAGQQARDDYMTAVGARAVASLNTPAPFVERLVHFWANHFAVSADKLQIIGLSGMLEFDAIRPHVLGKFSDMLNAVERHPAMLLYLDQAQSIGPNSFAGSRASANGRKVGLNENLAREIMELHTLGVRTGYAQGDVTEFARAMTGWTVAGIGRGPGARLLGAGGEPGDFVFVPALHEPGDRTIMGKHYADHGVGQAQAVLDDLAASPATAHHIATKLCRHFIADDPPPAAVERVAAAFTRSGGDLPSVYRALIASPEAWNPAATKFKTPWEWSISTMRGLGQKQVSPLVMTGLMNQLGQPVWKPGSPAGYDDVAGSWAGPDAVLRRVEAAERFATRAPAEIDARALAPKLFPAAVSEATQTQLARAESPGQALALLLVSPEAMRR